VETGGSGLRHSPQLPIRDLAALLARARLVVANGGDTLLQALSFQRVCVAAPLAQDQIGRIRHCADAGIATSVELDELAVASAADELLRDGDRRARLTARMAQLPIRNELDVAVNSLVRLAA
jgi:spore coat polysaccharide biosynthesis predicted glycosyltransferase SpsG